MLIYLLIGLFVQLTITSLRVIAGVITKEIFSEFSPKDYLLFILGCIVLSCVNIVLWPIAIGVEIWFYTNERV